MKDLVKWRGLSPERRQRRGFGSLFDWDPFEILRENFIDVFDDAVSYYDDSKNLVIELEVPGFNKDNIDVELSGGFLTVKGKRETKTECYVGCKEINKRYSVGNFEDATAEVTDGILKITIHTPKEEVKKIEVKSNE